MPTRQAPPIAITPRRRHGKQSALLRRSWNTVSVRVWKIDGKAILNRLRRWAQELGRDENVLAVVLFGSLARGDHTPASDADLLIILRDSPLRFDERIPAFMPSGIGIGVDVFPYTLDEVRRGVEEGWGVAGIALKEGIFLFKKDTERLPFKVTSEKQ